MPSIISFGPKLIRINFSKNSIELSPNGGLSWLTRYNGSFFGAFKDLLEYDGEILALTDKGLYYSTNDGVTWKIRCTASFVKSFDCIQEVNGELIAMTDDGHIYYSPHNGITWLRRR